LFQLFESEQTSQRIHIICSPHVQNGDNALPTRSHKTRLVTMERWSLTLSKLWILGQTSSSSLSSVLLVLLTIWLLLAHHQVNCSNINNYHIYNYDQTSQQFTPDGRLVQVEYASHAVEQSSPVVVVECNLATATNQAGRMFHCTTAEEIVFRFCI
jgi:hypothetical protein